MANVGLVPQLPHCGLLLLVGKVQDTELLHEHAGGGVAGSLVQGCQLFLGEWLGLEGPDGAVIKLMINC